MINEACCSSNDIGDTALLADAGVAIHTRRFFHWNIAVC